MTLRIYREVEVEKKKNYSLIRRKTLPVTHDSSLSKINEETKYMAVNKRKENKNSKRNSYLTAEINCKACMALRQRTAHTRQSHNAYGFIKTSLVHISIIKKNRPTLPFYKRENATIKDHSESRTHLYHYRMRRA